MAYKAKETDFFKQTNILLTLKHRTELEDIKRVATLSSNINTDTSTFIRAILDYISDNPSFCDKLKKYISNNKGSTYVSKYNDLRRQNKSIQEIAEVLGVETDIIERIVNKETKKG